MAKDRKQRGLGEYSFGSTIPSRELFRQRGYRSFIKQRGYNVLMHPRQRGEGIGSIFRSFIRIAKPLFRKGIAYA